MKLHLDRKEPSTDVTLKAIYIGPEEGNVTFVKNHASSFTKIRSRRIDNVKGCFLSFETY